MKQRTTAPSNTNKYYLVKTAGYNTCILGNKTIRPCTNSSLPNCTGFATARFAEIIGDKKCKYFGNTHAKNYFALAKKQGLETGATPRAGAVICWGSTNGGCGHVAIVEQVNSAEEIITSESGWSYTARTWMRKTRKKGNGNWGQNANYKFLGFAYNPQINPFEAPNTTLKYSSRGEGVKWLQWAINRSKAASIAIDGSFGKKTQAGLKKAQTLWKKNGYYKGVIDGECGNLTRKTILDLYALERV